MKSIFALGTFCLAVGGITSPLLAQDDADVRPVTDELKEADNSEIIVTAARQRAEPVQRAPVAVTVLPASVIEKLNAPNIAALSSLAPNLTISDTTSVAGLATISLRGFVSRFSDIAAEPSVAVYVDNVYQVAQPGSLVDLFDVASIEVLRGPQGTLLGKNAPAGALLINRSRPTGKFGVKLRAEYGSFDKVQMQALLNFPIVDGILSGKVYGRYHERGDYIRNLAIAGQTHGSTQQSTIRGALLFEPSDAMRFYLTGDYTRDRSDSQPGRSVSRPDTASCLLFGFCAPDADRRRVTRADFFDPVRQDDYSATLVSDLGLGPVAIKSTTGYRDYRSNTNIDLDGTSSAILHAFDNGIRLKSFSEEVRLNSTKGGGLDMGGRLDWVAGAYYSRSRGRANQALYAFGGASSTNQTQRVNREGYAVYGSVDAKVWDELSVNFGTRYSHDKTDHLYVLPFASSYPDPTPVAPVPFSFESGTYTNTSIEAGAKYQFTPDQMVFVRYAEGYRGGGFQGFPLDPAGSPYSPENSRSYEAGVKTEWLQRSLRVNLTLFKTSFTNLQRDVVIGTSTGLTQLIASAAADTRGVELETSWKASRDLLFRASFGYLDAKFTRSFVPDGSGGIINANRQDLPYAPKYTANFSGEYSIDVSRMLPFMDSLVLQGSVDTRSDFQFSTVGADIGKQKGYTITNLSATLNSIKEKYSLGVYANNIFNVNYYSNVADITGVSDSLTDALGAVYGVWFQVKF